MSYQKKTWQNGELIKEADLNSLETIAAQNASDIDEIRASLPTYVGEDVVKKGATTYTPGTSEQSIPANTYLTGKQTIKAIPSEYVVPSGIKEISTNGTHNVKSYESVSVNVPTSGGSAPVLQEKTVTPTKEILNVTPDNSYDGLSEVTVNPIPAPYIIPSGTKEILTNGTHNITEFASVKVNVPTSGSESGLTVKSGTVTDSATIETGLSSVEYFIIYKTTLTATGVIQAAYGNNGTTANFVYCSSYSSYIRTCAPSTCTPTISGGTITWPNAVGNSNGFTSGDTYHWVAFGVE